MFQKQIHTLRFMLVILTISACGKDDESSASGPTIFGKNFSLVSGDLVTGDSSVEGSGAITFGQVVDQAESGRNFVISFTVQDGGSVALKAFANQDLSSSSGILFQRQGDILNYTVQQGNRDTTAKLEGVNASETVTLSVEIHNDESPAHVMIWSGEAVPQEEPLELSANNGTGTYVGFALENAKLVGFKDSEVKFDE